MYSDALKDQQNYPESPLAKSMMDQAYTVLFVFASENAQDWNTINQTIPRDQLPPPPSQYAQIAAAVEDDVDPYRFGLINATRIHTPSLFMDRPTTRKALEHTKK